MKVEIEQTNNGFLVTYEERDTYIYRSVDDLVMLQEIAKRFLKRDVRVAVK